MLTKKAIYGLKAVLYLSQKLSAQEAVLISDIAYHAHIPKKFLESILLELKKKGVLHSKKGKGGGYTLANAADRITVGEIMRALDGPLAPVSCVSESAYRRCDECVDEHRCGIRIVMKDVRDAMSNILDNVTLADVQKKIANCHAAPLTYSI